MDKTPTDTRAMPDHETVVAENENSTKRSEKSPLEDPGAPGGTAGTGGTNSDQDG